SMALLLKDENTIANFLRENNRFNNMLARLEEAAPSEEGQMIQRIRTAQDEILTTVADIANLIRDGKVDEAMTLQLKNGYPQYQQIDRLVNQVVKTEEDKMGALSQIVTAVHRRALILMGGFVGASILLALLLGFVTSWSFILPVQEAQGFLDQVIKGDFRTTINVPNRDEFGALAVINDVLDLSKIEAGRMELLPTEYAARDIVETVRAALRSLAVEKGLEFVAGAQADMPVAFGDRQRITQCLMNLAGNALKFTR